MSDTTLVFAARLRALREAAGLSVAHLAEASSVHRTHLYQLERGTRSPQWETVQRLADALHVSTDALR